MTWPKPVTPDPFVDETRSSGESVVESFFVGFVALTLGSFIILLFFLIGNLLLTRSSEMSWPGLMGAVLAVPIGGAAVAIICFVIFLIGRLIKKELGHYLQ